MAVHSLLSSKLKNAKNISIFEKKILYLQEDEVNTLKDVPFPGN